MTSSAASTFSRRIVLVEDVGDPDADAVDLVGVRRPDAASRRTDLVLAQEALGDLVDRGVVRRDHVRVGADHELAHRHRRARSSRRARGTAPPGETTTPLAITEVQPGVRIPLGSRWVANFWPSTTIVWPALWPPLVRTQKSMASSVVSRSVALPLPSSPHWAPSTTIRGHESPLHRRVWTVRTPTSAHATSPGATAPGSCDHTLPRTAPDLHPAARPPLG